MTKEYLKKRMCDLINQYYERAEKVEDEDSKKSIYSRVAGIERLAMELGIKLWE